MKIKGNTPQTSSHVREGKRFSGRNLILINSQTSIILNKALLIFKVYL